MFELVICVIKVLSCQLIYCGSLLLHHYFGPPDECSIDSTRDFSGSMCSSPSQIFCCFGECGHSLQLQGPLSSGGCGFDAVLVHLRRLCCSFFEGRVSLSTLNHARVGFRPSLSTRTSFCSKSFSFLAKCFAMASISSF